MTCSTCGGPVHYQPEEPADPYGQTYHLCRRFPVCRGDYKVGPADADIYRREQPMTVPARVRTVDQMLEGEWQ